MEDFDDPLDILDDDGDGVMEMCLLFDDDKKGGGGKPPQNSGCCVVFLALGSSVLLSAFGISKMLV